MTVYVDSARHTFGRMKMSHMMADSVDELHSMADRIGLNRKWFQPKSSPHYDVCQEYRQRAIAAGAVVVDRRKLVEIIRKLRS
jgi:hypothetical protein